MRNVMNWIKYIVLLIILIILPLGLLEFGVRTIYPDTVLFNRFHETVNYGEYITRRLRPSTTFKHTSQDGVFIFRTNSSGFRMEQDISQPKNDGTLRILVLGDSHAQGFEVQGDETFSSLLDKRSCRNETLEVINTGISGSGTSEHLITLQHFYDELSPDLVIETFYPNDLQNNKNAFHGIVDGELRVIRKTHPATNGIKLLEVHNNFFVTRFLSQNSYAYSLFMNFIWEQGRSYFYGSNKSNTSELVELKDNFNQQKPKYLFNLIIDEMRDIVEKESRFILIGIPSRKSYEIRDIVDSRHEEIIVDIEFDAMETWHVKHGHRHINSKSHKRIAETIFQTICTDK